MAHGNPPFLTGTLELIVLQLLRAEPTSGYELTLRIQAVSKDVLNVNAGAAAGVTLAIFRVLLAISGGLAFNLVFDRTILSFAVGVALAAGLIFGISPALHATRTALTGALRDSATAIAGGGGPGSSAAWTNPIGRRVQRVPGAAEPMTLEVVGVYEEADHALGHSGDDVTIFLPPDPRPAVSSTTRYILLRTSSPAEAMIPVIRDVVRNEAPRAAITGLRTLASLEDEARFTLLRVITLFSTAGLVVLLLAGLGLYAVVAFAVAQRTGEIAVRVAIGARAWQIVRQVAADGLRLSTLGIALGLPFSVLRLRWLLGLAPDVPDVSPTLVTALVALGVLAVSSAAIGVPARRAPGVDPAAVLRRE